MQISPQLTTFLRNRRWLLFVLGVALILLSLAALLYALNPTEIVREQATLVPTLFSPPP